MRTFKALPLFVLFLIFTAAGFPQGINTTANKDEWEEINFETGSDVLVDGFPSLLREAELLSQHPDYKAQVVGHGDGTGSNAAAEKLGMKRAEAVKAYLVKYGARPDQVQTSSAGNGDPKVPGRTKEGRFMNRRATTRLLNGQGQPVAACPCEGMKPLQDEINRLQQAAQQAARDAAARAQQQQDRINQLEGQVRDQTAAAQAARQSATEAAANTQRTADAAKAADAAAAAAQQAATQRATELQNKLATSDAALAAKLPRFSLLGLNVGADSNRDATFTGSGRFFAPFHKSGAYSAAAQIQGEYMYFTDRREAQGDIGLVNRYKDFQLGGFASFRNIWMKNMLSTGTLGQASFLADYLFGPGKLGIYGSKTFLNDAVINRVSLGTGTAQRETYLHAVDALGVNGAMALGKSDKSPWIDGNLGWLKSGNGNKKAGGTARLVFPVSRLLALTAEGGVNESLVGSGNYGRAVFGILFGNQTHPTEYRAADHAVPMLVPRVRYEMLTRRIGNDAPVANAGPDQIGIPAGTVRLDGSKSFDPNGDPLTFLWTQLAGPTVTLAGANTANPTFAAAANLAYSFALTVSDGTSSNSSRVAIVTRETPRPVITRFTANPASVTAGQVSTLNWVVENADTVTISGINQTLAKDSGTVNVTPSQTTNYTLTATNTAGQATAVAVVTIIPGGGGTLPVIASFTANPTSIQAGGSSTLSWNVTGADRVVIDNGIGQVNASGTRSVSPSATTLYTLTAFNASGQVTATANVAVAAGRVKITSFTVTPDRLVLGTTDLVTFNWTTENATSVTLEPGGGLRGLNGTVSLTAPTATRTYTLRAVGEGADNTDTATVTVTVANVAGGPQIIIPLNNFYTAFRNVQLDARGSFDPAGGTLTFEWRSVDGKATVVSPSSALTPVILEDTYYGDFIFEVKVTNSGGVSATRRVVVTLPVGGCGLNNGCVPAGPA
jgi:flagellar motor protein MotB